MQKLRFLPHPFHRRKSRIIDGLIA
jgi:hypothetical protein